MHVSCPHCHHRLEVVDDDPLTDVSCPTCGSQFHLVSGQQTIGAFQPGRRLGRFELLEQLGMGSFGSVWKAHDEQLDRLVAIKIPRRESVDAVQIEQFIREARAAAQLKHPHIVPVHEVGREGETVYIVSEFVNGADLREWTADRQLPADEATRLCEQVAEAIHHAHEAGVVHRDLKPANIMMDLNGEPHVMDFGLAKRESGEITMTYDGRVLGTPAYMPPEQARGEGHNADRRSDVYSLGVILFELLTGETPFRGQTRMLIVQILNEEPPNPRALDARIPKDLATICLKCLEKSPDRRYATAADLANDLRRFVEGRPIKARPISRLERGWRWCKRNPSVAALASGIMVTVTVALVVISALWIEASGARRDLAQSLTAESAAKQEALAQNALAQTQTAAAIHQRQIAEQQRQAAIAERKRAEMLADNLAVQKDKAEQSAKDESAARRRMEQTLYFNRVMLAARELEAGRSSTAEKVLAICPAQDRGWEWHYLKRQCDTTSARFRGVPALLKQPLAYVSSRNAFVFQQPDNRIMLFDANNQLEEFAKPVINLSFLSTDPAGERLVGVAKGATFVWDLDTQKLLTAINVEADKACFNSDGSRLVLMNGDLWSVELPSGELTKITLDRRGSHMWDACFVGTNKIAVANGDRGARIFDLDTGQELCQLDGKNMIFQEIAADPSGHMVATVGEHKAAFLWDATTGQLLRTFYGHTDATSAVSFSADGKRLITGASDKTVRVWDVATAELTHVLHGGRDQIRQVHADAQTARVAGLTADGKVQIWDLDRVGVRLLDGPTTDVKDVTISTNGTALAATAQDGVHFWSVRDDDTYRAIGKVPVHVDSVAFVPDATMILLASPREVARVEFSDSSLQALKPLEPRSSTKAIVNSIRSGAQIAVSLDGRTIAATYGKKLAIWKRNDDFQLAFEKELGAHVSSVAINHEGSLVAYEDPIHTVNVFDVASSSVVAKYSHRGYRTYVPRVGGVAFSRDGRRVFSVGADMIIRMWDAQTGAELRQLPGHEGPVSDIVISRDGKRMASSDFTGSVHLWDVDTGESVLMLQAPHPINALDFSRDGRLLAACRRRSLSATRQPMPILVWDGRETTAEKSVDHSHSPTISAANRDLAQ